MVGYSRKSFAAEEMRIAEIIIALLFKTGEKNKEIITNCGYRFLRVMCIWDTSGILL